jgi:hypothetical protein
MKKSTWLFIIGLMASSYSLAQKAPILQRSFITPNGVVMKIVRPGNDDINPKKDSNVSVHYRGILKNGTEFDSSYRKGVAVNLNLNEVIDCWKDALSFMSVGSVAHIYCPSNMAYGDEGIPGVIPANADLLFEVELISIAKDKKVEKIELDKK